MPAPGGPRGIFRRVATLAPDGMRGVSGSADAGAGLMHVGADHVVEAPIDVEGNASFIVHDGVDLDMPVDRRNSRPGGPFVPGTGTRPERTWLRAWHRTR